MTEKEIKSPASKGRPRSRKKRQTNDSGKRILIAIGAAAVVIGVFAGAFFIMRPYLDSGKPTLPLETQREIAPETLEAR